MLMRKCISSDGDALLNKIETGRIDDCSLLKQVTFMLIEHILKKVKPLPLTCLIPCDLEYSNNMGTATHDYLNKFLNFANQHCRNCR